MKFCSTCGKEIDNNSNFCNSCGSSSNIGSMKNHQPIGWWIIFAIGIIGYIIIITSAIILADYSVSEDLAMTLMMFFIISYILAFVGGIMVLRKNSKGRIGIMILFIILCTFFPPISFIPVVLTLNKKN